MKNTLKSILLLSLLAVPGFAMAMEKKGRDSSLLAVSARKQQTASLAFLRKAKTTVVEEDDSRLATLDEASGAPTVVSNPWAEDTDLAPFSLDKKDQKEKSDAGASLPLVEATEATKISLQKVKRLGRFLRRGRAAETVLAEAVGNCYRELAERKRRSGFGEDYSERRHEGAETLLAILTQRKMRTKTDLVRAFECQEIILNELLRAKKYEEAFSKAREFAGEEYQYYAGRSTQMRVRAASTLLVEKFGQKSLPKGAIDGTDWRSSYGMTFEQFKAAINLIYRETAQAARIIAGQVQSIDGKRAKLEEAVRDASKADKAAALAELTTFKQAGYEHCMLLLAVNKVLKKAGFEISYLGSTQKLVDRLYEITYVGVEDATGKGE